MRVWKEEEFLITPEADASGTVAMGAAKDGCLRMLTNAAGKPLRTKTGIWRITETRGLLT